MKKSLVFALTIILLISSVTVFSVTYAEDTNSDFVFDAQEIKSMNSWNRNGSLTLTQNGNESFVRFKPNITSANGFGITVNVPVEKAKFVVVRYDTNLFDNYFMMAYAEKSDFDYNYTFGETKHKHSASQKVTIFNMSMGIEAASEAGESSIKYVKFAPWCGQEIFPEGSLSDCYFDVYSIAFFETATEANYYALEIQGFSPLDYDSLPESDALYTTNDLNDGFAWIKNGYRAEIIGTIDGPFKFIPSSRASNGIGFKVDVPTSKAKYVVIRYYTNVNENTFRIAYSHDDTYDYNKQYGIASTNNTVDKRTALFDMSTAVNAAKNANVSSIKYFKVLPWQGQSWTGSSAMGDNFFNVYSVAFFENKSDAEAYQTALEAALPLIDFDKSHDNSSAMAMESVKVDTTPLDNMIAAFKAKENDTTPKENKLIIYPEYPERIGRDYDYSVKVSQGGEEYSIPVYNELRQGAATRNYYGDDYRRFCEFAFRGEPVRIDITVNVDFSEYTIIPAAKNIPSTVNGNVISLYVSEPMQLIVRLGNDIHSNNTNLAIFVDPPEENVPDKDDPKVIYIDGWYEEEDNELNITESGTTVYIAPGAVCNARVLSNGNSNVTITGRGMVRDPHDTRSNNSHSYNYNVNIRNGNNIRIDGIKILDCRFYHLYLAGVNTAEIYNVKIFSNQISTDGYLISGTNIYMHDSYADVGDDAFTGAGTNKYYEDMLVGSTCGIFSLAGLRNNETYKDINIFRADEAIFKNYYGTGVFIGAKFENIFAVDCPYTPYFLASKDQGDGMKNFIFKNVSLNTPAGVAEKNTAFNKYTGKLINIVDGNIFQFDFENIYIDGKLISSPSGINVNDRSTSGAVVNVTTSETETYIPLTTNTTVLAKPYDAPEKVKTPLHNGENLLKNGNFESTAAPWVCVDFSYIYLTDDANSGEKSLYIPASTDSSGEDQRGGITAYITEEINRGGAGNYLIEFYAKKAPGHEGSDISAVFGYYYGEITETTTMTYKSPSKRCTLTEEWQKYSYTVTVGVDEVNRAALSIHRGSGNTFPPLDFYVDDISIVKLPVMLGDTSDDGEVTNIDIVHLARQLAGWKGYVKYANLANSDFNGDLTLNSLDSIYLARHSAGWNGYKSLSPAQ